MASMLDLFIPHLIAMGLLYAAIPATQTLSAAGSKQILGGTMGIGKVAMGAYAGYKIGEKAVTGTASRVNAGAKRNAGYRKFTENVGNRLANTKTPFVAGAYLKTEANKAQQMEVRVKAHKDAMKTFTPERMNAYINSKLDPQSKVEARKAMHDLLLEKQKTTDTDYMKAGYVTKGVNGADALDINRLKHDLQIIQNHGGDMSDIYKQRVDFAAPKDIEKEVNKIIDKGELGKLKLDAMLNDDVAMALQKVVSPAQLGQWMNNKSQGEKNNYINQKEQSVASKWGGLSVDDKKKFRIESAMLAGKEDKAMRMAEIDSTAPVKDGKLNYVMVGAGYKVDDAIFQETVSKFNRDSLVGMDKGLLRDKGHHLSKSNITQIGNAGSKDQVEAIKDSLEDKAGGAGSLVVTIAKQGGKKGKAAIKKQYETLSDIDKALCDKLVTVYDLT